MSDQIHFREMGSGPPLILLHGYGGSAHHWEIVAKSLARSHRVILVSLSKMFFSEQKLLFAVQIEMIAEFIRLNFGQQKVSVAGLSFGGALAWGLALRHPEMCDRVSLINPMVPNPVKSFRPKEMKYFFSVPLSPAAIAILLISPMGQKFLRIAAEVFRDERLEGGVSLTKIRGKKLMFVSHIIYRFAWVLKKEEWNFWSDELIKNKLPTQLIFCKDDLLFDENSYRQLASKLNVESVVELSGAGHLAIKSQPEKVAVAIEEFLLAPTKKQNAG